MKEPRPFADEVPLKPELQAVIDHLHPPPNMSADGCVKWREDVAHFVKAFGEQWANWMIEHYGASLLSAAITRMAERVAHLAPFEPKLIEAHVKDGHFECGVEMAKGFLAVMVKSFAELNKDAPNYTESEVEMLSCGKKFIVTVRNGGKPTPHELRQKAEARVVELEAAVKKLTQELNDAERRMNRTALDCGE